MKILLDMNLSPAWVATLAAAGFEAVHWINVGKPDALDSEIMRWALGNDYVVFTHDLDFGDILAATNANAPSVIQIRTQNGEVAKARGILEKAVEWDLVAQNPFEELLLRFRHFMLQRFVYVRNQ